MIIFKDRFTGDELCSDSYTYKVVDEVVYEVQGKTVSENLDIDDNLIGGNASAEGCGDDGGVDPASRTGVDVVMANRLVETGFTKKQYQAHIRGYMRNVLDKLKGTERADVFKKHIEGFVKGVLKEFNEYQFFLGESLGEDGMVILMKYPEGSTSPKLYLFKDGLEEEKC